MDTEVIALAFIMFVAIGVSIGILTSVNNEVFGSPGDKLKEVFKSVADSIMPGKSYDICEEYNNKLISQNDFEVILQAMSKGECSMNSTNLQLSFSLSQKEINNLTKGLEIAKNGENVFFRPDIDTLGIGAVIVHGNPGYYTLKMWDRIKVDYTGQPNKDLIISVADEGCDPYDQNCEVMCSYMEGICDPLCYRDNDKEDVVCDIDCVDTDHSGNITGADRDGVCDRDCYTNRLAPDRAYDPDCVWKNKATNDSICDPNSNGVLDGVCDPDCAVNETICDPDCNGLESEGNPNALLSPSCYICDKTCNGFCSMSCVKEDKDPDCPEGFGGFNNLTACCGNGKCDTEESENCQACIQDCPGAGVTCEDFGKICCPSAVAIGGDEFGCSQNPELPEGGSCTCSSQCDQSLNLSCNGGRCCPAGYMWSSAESKCVSRTDVLIVAIKGNMKSVYSEAQIAQLEAKIKEFQQALAVDGLGSSFLYLDSNDTESICGKKVTSISDWKNIQATIVPLIKKLESKYLIILGGYQRFPQSSVAPTGSDAAYGDINSDGKYLMDIAVGRLPDPNGGDLATIINALDTAIKLHKSGGLVLTSHISPIMGCGGYDNSGWNSGKCFCEAAYGSDCKSCGSCCGNIGPSSLGGKDFATILAHGPGPSTGDLLKGGGIVVGGTGWMGGMDVSNAMWMPMACGGGYLKGKQTTSSSIVMNFLKNGGAIFIGSTNNNLGAKTSGCPVLGGDNSVGSLYVEIVAKFQVGKRIGDAYMEGKNSYFPKYNCPYGQSYHYHISCLYGDPTLKIKALW